jgi:hypothetical protein
MSSLFLLVDSGATGPGGPSTTEVQVPILIETDSGNLDIEVVAGDPEIAIEVDTTEVEIELSDD